MRITPVHHRIRPLPGLWFGALSLLTAMGGGADLFAHPVPRSEYDRNITVVLESDAVLVTYRLEIDVFTLFHDVGQNDSGFVLDRSRKVTLDDFSRAFIERMRIVIPDHLLATVNDQRLTFRTVKTSYSQPDSVQFHFVFRAPFAAVLPQNSFELEEINFPEKKGALKLSFDTVASVPFLDYAEPSERSAAKNDEKMQRTLTARFEASTVPKDQSAASVETSSNAPPAPANASLFARLFKDGLRVLLESSYGLPVLLLFAFFFGAAHALTPGHGKTLVAAYLIGEKGTVRHAVFLGIVTTVSHTGSVILIALGLWIWYPNADREDVRRALGLIGGLIIILLGMWILISRLAGRADHVHLFGNNHSHAEGGEHAHSHGVETGASWSRLLLLGITGGLIPCWDAVLMLGIAVSTDQMRLALPLLFSFSAGLAATLVAVGIAVLRASRAGRMKWQERRWMKALPIISAILVILIGISLCAGSV